MKDTTITELLEMMKDYQKKQELTKVILALNTDGSGSIREFYRGEYGLTVFDSLPDLIDKLKK
jgi:hypothetical protein